MPCVLAARGTKRENFAWPKYAKTAFLFLLSSALRPRPRPINNRPLPLSRLVSKPICQRQHSKRSRLIWCGESEHNRRHEAYFCLPNLAEHFVSLLSFHFSGLLLTGQSIRLRTGNEVSCMVFERHLSNSNNSISKNNPGATPCTSSTWAISQGIWPLRENSTTLPNVCTWVPAGLPICPKSVCPKFGRFLVRKVLTEENNNRYLQSREATWHILEHCIFSKYLPKFLWEMFSCFCCKTITSIASSRRDLGEV